MSKQPSIITVLLVDDEPALIKLSSMMLRRLGYACLTAETAEEAIRIACDHACEIDLLMTDVMLPEMNGHDLAERIVASRPGIKRLYVSGYTANIITAEDAIEPDVAFLPKPFTRGQLAAKLDELFCQD